MSETTTTPESFRDSQGRFTKGNPGGPGNPFARLVARKRQAAVNAVPDDDIADIMRQLVVMAKEGDRASARLVLGYVIGKPVATVDPDRLDLDEWNVLKAESGTMAELPQVGAAPSASLPLEIVRETRPYVDIAIGAKLSDAILPPSTNGKLNRKQRRAQKRKKAAEARAKRTGASPAGPAQPA